MTLENNDAPGGSARGDCTADRPLPFVLRPVADFLLARLALLRVVSLGRYPPSQTSPHNGAFVSIVGLATCIAVITFYYSHAH